MCIDKVRDVGFSKTVAGFNFTPAHVDIFQRAVTDEAHDLISRAPEPGGGLFWSQQRGHRRIPVTVILSFLWVNRYSARSLTLPMVQPYWDAAWLDRHRRCF